MRQPILDRAPWERLGPRAAAAFDGRLRCNARGTILKILAAVFCLCSDDIGAGEVIRSSYLNKMLPHECLAVTWSYEKHPDIAESNLLWHYFESFGEAPPLNIKRSRYGWSDFPDDKSADRQ